MAELSIKNKNKNKWLYKTKRDTKTVALQKERQESLKRINLNDLKSTFRYLGKLVSCSLVSGLHACKPAEPALPTATKKKKHNKTLQGTCWIFLITYIIK